MEGEGEKKGTNDGKRCFSCFLHIACCSAQKISPFPGYFCGVKYCSKVFSSLRNVLCIVAAILWLSCYQTSTSDAFANTNRSNLKGNLLITFCISLLLIYYLLADLQTWVEHHCQTPVLFNSQPQRTRSIRVKVKSGIIRFRTPLSK